MKEASNIRTAQCRQCHAEYTFEVRLEDYAAWRAGRLIQEVMPYLSAAIRELMISGTCGPCVDAMIEDLSAEGDAR